MELATIRVSHYHLVLVQTQRQAEEWENFIVKQKKNRVQVCPDWKLVAWGSRRCLTRSGVSSVIG